MNPRDSIPAIFVALFRNGSTRAAAMARIVSASSNQRHTSAWPPTHSNRRSSASLSTSGGTGSQ
jgi:hypothetical protein